MPHLRTGSGAELRAGWRLIVAAFLGTAFGLPTLPFYSVGIFAPIFAAQFGWSFAAIFGGLVITTLTLLLGGTWIGHMIDRRGARAIAAASLAALGLGYMALALLDGSIAQYYLIWLMISVAGIGATSISFTAVINTAFTRRRGFALGLALSGIGFFALVVKPWAGWLIDVAGWRTAVVAIGALPLFLAAPVAFWALPTHSTAAAPAAALPQLALGDAIRTRAFVLLVCAFVAISFANGAPIPHLENILRTAHIESHEILGLTAGVGAAIILGRIAGGWLLDRVWAPIVGVAVLSAASCGLLMLSHATLDAPTARLAILLLGFAGGVEVDLLPYLTARYIGVRSYGAIYGTLFGLFALGAGIGPTLIGWSFDRFNSYSQILTVCAGLLVLAALLLLCLGRYPQEPRS
jgi:predicted MFS family arabinose efflux permease